MLFQFIDRTCSHWASKEAWSSWHCPSHHWAACARAVVYKLGSLEPETSLMVPSRPRMRSRRAGEKSGWGSCRLFMLQTQMLCFYLPQKLGVFFFKDSIGNKNSFAAKIFCKALEEWESIQADRLVEWWHIFPLKVDGICLLETAKHHLESKLVKRYVSTRNKKADCGHDMNILYMWAAHEVSLQEKES